METFSALLTLVRGIHRSPVDSTNLIFYMSVDGSQGPPPVLQPVVCPRLTVVIKPLNFTSRTVIKPKWYSFLSTYPLRNRQIKWLWNRKNHITITTYHNISKFAIQPFIRCAECGEFTGDWRISRSKGQYRGKGFHLMTSSWRYRDLFVDQEPAAI